MTIHAAFGSDDSYVIPTLVAITSLFENNRDCNCNVYVVSPGMSESSIDKFRKLSMAYSQPITILNIHEELLYGLVERGRFPLAMYYRFLLPKLLPEVKKVLYLDCDILVRDSLQELFNTDIESYACAAVMDQQCDDVTTINRLQIDSIYFNSGVLLMNLEEWRKWNYTHLLCEFIRNNPAICIYPDQDALNVVLGGKVKYIEPCWNVQELWLTSYDKIHFHYSRYAQLQNALSQPKIIHFCVGDKPWFIECKNPYEKEYQTYAHKHDFIGYKQQRHYSWVYHRLEAEILRLGRWQKKFINSFK